MNYSALLRDCDAAIITSQAALYYLSGFDQSDATIVITNESSYYLTNSLYEIAAKSFVRSDLIVKVLTRGEQLSFLRSVVSAASKVGVECDDMTLSRYHAIFQGEKGIVDLSPLLAEMRKVKTAEEVEIIKTAESIVDNAFSFVRTILRPGVSELEVKEAIRRSMVSDGAEDTAFDTIVAFGERAAMPHAVSSDRVLAVGDCILMDFGANYQGYMSDFTRTLFCGEPSEKARAAYQTVLSAQLAAIDYIDTGGRSAREADRIAREVIEKSAFQGKFTHTLGHGVGIMIHEAPTLSSLSSDELSDGMVFTVEPGVYLEGEFGIRIESLCVLEKGKLTVIDRSDKEIIIV